MALPRRAYIRVEYDGQDITEAVSNTVTSLTYVDKASNEADDLTLYCHDRENNWIGSWYPKLKIGGS